MPPADEDDAFAATIAPPAAVAAAASPPASAGAGAGNTTGKRTVAIGKKTPLAPGADETLAAPSRPPAGRRAMASLPEVPDGHYEPDREIARGGMGRIVAAQDLRLGRPVALKELLEPAPDQISRFQREALITARLQHPGIVPVYEAGVWPSGEPFFAMKLVNGRPLDRVIADAHTLPQRLVLLPRIAAAADAMAYAHSKRIVHRDLKPANVLIGEFGETVVIDWGLAKDLDSDDTTLESGTRVAKPRANRPSTPPPPPPTSQSSTLTIAGAVMGTPAYMAPEQARGEPVDQRADVFALGAMLYHLLTGAPPYNARTATDVIAAAALGNVTPLLEREKRAPADLVAIVTRAMAPLQNDRYPDAGELADELRRFMTGQLVGAHRYTAIQRVTRFVRKHRAAVTISVVATLGFAIGGTLAVRNIVESRDNMAAEKALETTRSKAAEHLVDFMISDVQGRLSQIGRLDLLAGLGGEVRHYYDSLASVPGGMRGNDTDRMAQAIDLIGFAELKSGKPDLAFASWSEARAQLAASLGTKKGPWNRSRRRMIASLDVELGGVYQQRGKMADAVASYTTAKHEYDALKDEDDTDRAVMIGAADTHDRLGDILRNEGKIDDAYEEYTEARSERERASGQGNGQPSEEVLALSTSHVKLASIHQARGESQQALDEYRAALRLRDTLLESQPDNAKIQEAVVDLEDTMADLERQLGDDKSAIEIYRQALPTMEVLVRRDVTNTTWKKERGDLLSDLGFALTDSGDFKDGLEQLSLAIASQQELVGRDPDNAAWAIDLSRTYTRAGDAHLYLGELDAGIAQYELAREIRQHLADKETDSVPYQRSVAWAYAKLANAYVLKNDLPRAIDAQERALELRQKLVDEAPSQSGFKNELASTEIPLGKLLAAKDPKRSGELIGSGVARARALVAADTINLEWQQTLVQGLLAQSDAAKVAGTQAVRAPLLTEALRVAEAAVKHAPQNAHWPGFVGEIQVGLAEVAMAAHDDAAAAAAWKAARDVLEPLARTGRLPSARRVLLDRARAGR